MNTVVIRNGKWLGFNTDVNGFLHPLRNLNKKISRCVVLGSGGASRAVLYGLMKRLVPQRVVLCARNRPAAQRLQGELRPVNREVEFIVDTLAAAEKYLPETDLLVNTTPIGMFPRNDEKPLKSLSTVKPDSIIYDLIYNPIQTLLLKEAEQCGRPTIRFNGFEMLIRQAAAAFQLWTGKDLPVDICSAALRRALAA